MTFDEIRPGHRGAAVGDRGAGVALFPCRVRIHGRAEIMSVKLHNLHGDVVHTVELVPETGA